MFGYFRFILALMVVASHCQVTIQGINLGVSAVVVFYILAGYVTAHLFTKIFWNAPNPLKNYFQDRFLRIFPLYIYVFMCTVIFLYMTQYGNPTFSFIKIMNNILIIPLNYGEILLDNRTIFTMKSFSTIAAIPQAGSLGLELQAYMILAFIVFYNKKFWKVLFGSLSLIIFAIAMFQNDVNTYFFGYIYLPGTFFMFLVGVSIYNTSLEKNDHFDRYFYVYVYCTVVVLRYYKYINDKFQARRTFSYSYRSSNDNLYS